MSGKFDYLRKARVAKQEKELSDKKKLQELLNEINAERERQFKIFDDSLKNTFDEFQTATGLVLFPSPTVTKISDDGSMRNIPLPVGQAHEGVVGAWCFAGEIFIGISLIWEIGESGIRYLFSVRSSVKGKQAFSKKSLTSDLEELVRLLNEAYLTALEQ